MMLVVLARPGDAAARRFVIRNGEQDTALLTPTDLSRAGWSFDPADPATGTAVVGGTLMSVREIRAVVTRLPAVLATDLPHIVSTDRDYAAEETHAFLLAWLSALPCPVLNRPMPPSLAGPNWQQARWIHTAGCAGLQAPQPAKPAPHHGRDHEVLFVIGGRCITQTEPPRAELAARLAQIAGLDLLAVALDRATVPPTFAWADPWPDLSMPELADALIAHLKGLSL